MQLLMNANQMFIPPVRPPLDNIGKEAKGEWLKKRLVPFMFLGGNNGSEQA